MATKQHPTSDAVKQIHYLAAALKAPRITEAAARLADQARDAGRSDQLPDVGPDPTHVPYPRQTSRES